MVAVRRVIGVIVGIIGLAVLINFVFSPFYEDSVDIGQVWSALNWFMAFGVIVAIGVAFHVRKESEERGEVDIRHVCAMLMFYTTLMLAIWFFWNWFDDLTVGDEGQSQTRLNYWSLINPLFIVMMGVVSERLVNSGKEG